MAPALPSVTALATQLDDGRLPGALIAELAKAALATVRDSGGDPIDVGRHLISALAARRPRAIVNATGVLLHTNLGRAPLHQGAADLAAEVARNPTALEMRLSDGGRGGRGDYVERLVTTVTGGEAALVVNNGAAALVLALAAIAGGREALVSRGEQIEIGGSFRLPDIMRASGARMVEVGTTNRTRAGDFADAAGPATALLLKVHPSNYRIEGFTQEVSYAQMVELGADLGVPFVADIGSGLLDTRVPWWDGPPPAWLEGEPAARQTLDLGASVVLFSGDKLLGGPQAGIAAGEAGAIAAMRRHPLARAFRIDGASLAALGATLELYASGRGAEIPFWNAAAIGPGDLRLRLAEIVSRSGVSGEISDGISLAGAGSAPGKGIPGPVLTVEADDNAWRRLLASGVVARRAEGAIVIDVRAVAPHQDALLAEALTAACQS